MTQAQNTNTTSNNSAAAVAKAIEAFYAKPAADGTGNTASIWINTVTTKGAPDFDGTINGQRVAMRIRSGEKGGFIAITKSLKPEEVKEDGYKEEQIGVANIVVNDRGFPIIAFKMSATPDQTIWANVSKNVPQDMLVQAGLNLDILGEKKAAFDAAKAAKADAAKTTETESAAA